MISTYLDTKLTDKQKELIEWGTPITINMLHQLDMSVVNQTYTIGLPYWSKRNPLLVKNFTWLMAKLDLGATQIRRNFSDFTFNMAVLDKAQLLDYRTMYKLDKMLMRKDINIYPNTLVKRNGKIHTDGIPRPGMMRAAKTTFMLDVDMLAKYKRPIRQNLIKSIKKGIETGNISDKFFADEASYRVVADYCVDNYLDPDAEYNSESNVQDQRGRAIKRILKRVGNYIANKDFRAMLKVPRSSAILLKQSDTATLNSIYLFIAELTGHKCLGQTEADKIEAGRQAYLAKELPRLDLKSEEDRKELHELIWLERIYARLDKLNKSVTKWTLWDIPIEIDHSMSLAQIVGALTNDERILKSTSVIGDELSDPWHIEGVRRLVAKSVGTPVFYGSSQSAISLVKAKNIDIDKEELGKLKREFASGRFSVLKQFKDLLIQNYNVHKPIIDIDTGITKFRVHVNKWKTVGYKTVVTEAYNGKTFRHSFTKEPERVPDYAHMKLFWATCLVHHLDSDLMEYNLDHNPDLWALDIHDAIICLPGQSERFRNTAARRLQHYRDNRYKIISSYRQSIGAITPKADVQYMKLMKSVHDAGETDFQPTLMK